MLRGPERGAVLGQLSTIGQFGHPLLRGSERGALSPNVRRSEPWTANPQLAPLPLMPLSGMSPSKGRGPSWAGSYTAEAAAPGGRGCAPLSMYAARARSLSTPTMRVATFSGGGTGR